MQQHSEPPYTPESFAAQHYSGCPFAHVYLLQHSCITSLLRKLTHCFQEKVEVTQELLEAGRASHELWDGTQQSL